MTVNCAAGVDRRPGRPGRRTSQRTRLSPSPDLCGLLHCRPLGRRTSLGRGFDPCEPPAKGGCRADYRDRHRSRTAGDSGPGDGTAEGTGLSDHLVSEFPSVDSISSPWWRENYSYLNPLSGLMTAYRDIFYRHQVPDARPLAMLFVLSIALLWMSSQVFEHRSEAFAELI